MLIKIAPVVLGLALSTCPFASEEPGGYARIAGTVRADDGGGYRGVVFIRCGESARNTPSDNQGRYAAEYTVGHLGLPDVPGNEGQFLLECRVSAGPGGQPPIAQTYVTVPFHRERGRRITTRVDLVEGQIESRPIDAAAQP